MKISDKIKKSIAKINDGIPFTYADMGIMPADYSAATKAIERLIKKGFLW